MDPMDFQGVMTSVIDPLFRMTKSVSGFVGLLIFMMGTWKIFTFYGDKHHKRDKTPVGYVGMLIAGTFLMAAGDLMGASSNLIFGNDGIRFDTQDVSTLAVGKLMVVKFFVAVVMLVGVIGFVIGLYEFSKISSGNFQGSSGTAIVKIIGGAVAFNIVAFANLIGDAFGGQVQKAIKMVLGT